MASTFRALGMDARTNVTLQGARSSHDIDVVVSFSRAGINVTWIIECKQWKRRIPREKVLALRAIVSDIGADRGFLMAESGFQTGALDASLFSNVTLTSVAELAERVPSEVTLTDIESLAARTESCRTKYWSIGKRKRIDLGLRPDIADMGGYSGARVIDMVESALRDVLIRGLPVQVKFSSATSLLEASDCAGGSVGRGISVRVFETAGDLLEFLSEEIGVLEGKLVKANEDDPQSGLK